MGDGIYCREKFASACAAMSSTSSNEENLIAAYEAGLHHIALTGTLGGMKEPLDPAVRERIDTMVRRLSWRNAGGDNTSTVVYSLEQEVVEEMLNELTAIHELLQTD